jgi:GTPase subunit of restriction endonuclease
MKVMHLILKYNDDMLNVDTIKEHTNMIKENGKVIWGIIKPKESSPGIGKDKINSINQQINSNTDTYAYMCTSGKITAKAKIEAFLTSEEIVQMKEYIPIYYTDKLNTCVGGVLINNIEKENSSIINEMVRYGTEGGDVAVGNQTNPLYVSFKESYKSMSSIEVKQDGNLIKSNLLDTNEKTVLENNEPIEKIMDTVEFIRFIYKYINSKGYIYSYEDLSNFYLSIKTKPFVILAGISGTGKSKLVRLFADALGSNMGNGKLSIIPVRPDWSDNTELIGYKNITGDFVPGKLIEIVKRASEDLERPYFVCLDEMNLARVEYYLSDYLSIIESRELVHEKVITDKIFNKNYMDNINYKDLILTENLYLVGTVNMDDTTYAFSRKVLDRANTIELSHVELDIVEFDADVLKNKFIHNDLLKSNFLSIKDAINYDKDYVIKILEEDIAMDYQIMQKILPIISGGDYNIKKVLIALFNLCSSGSEISDTRGYIDEAESYVDTARYKKSARKIANMLRELEDGFTSYWV